MKAIKADLSAIAARRKFEDRAFEIAGSICTLIGIVTLAALIIHLSIDGLSRIDFQFLSSMPSRFANRAGILTAAVGTLLVTFVTAAAAVPLGIAAGVYLEEYAGKNWLTDLIEVSISNLAGVPSIIFGLMALGLFVYYFQFGRSILSGGLTLACLILPIVIVSCRESLRSIPQGVREAAYAVGSSRWEVIRHHLLPYSTGGIATGVIIGLSRAMGETAPLVTIGAMTFIAFLPPAPLEPTPPFISTEWLWSPFTVLPIQMFNWTSRPGTDFQTNAAAAGIVLLVATLSVNAAAIAVRYYARRNIQW